MSILLSSWGFGIFGGLASMDGGEEQNLQVLFWLMVDRGIWPLRGRSRWLKEWGFRIWDCCKNWRGMTVDEMTIVWQGSVSF